MAQEYRNNDRKRISTLTSISSHTIVSVGAAFRPGGHSATIRSMTKSLSLSGFNALVFDDSSSRVLDRLDDIDHARDTETHSADLGTRLVFVRDVDPEEFLGTEHKTVAVVDLAPEPEDADSLEVLGRFDAVWGLSQWVVDQLGRGGIQAQWIGRSFEAPEQAYLPRRHFGLPDSARVVVLPFDADEFFSPCADGIHEAYVQTLLGDDVNGEVRIAILASASQPDLPEFPDDPRISFHDLTEDDYQADSLLNTADCVVSFDMFLRVAKSLGRAEWLGCPVLAMGASADGDLVGQRAPRAAVDEEIDVAAMAKTFAQNTRSLWGADVADGDAATFPKGKLLTETSYRAVGLRLAEALNKLSS